MKVALYQEGGFWKGPDIVRIFVSVEAALPALPNGFEINQFIARHIYAENSSRERWATIKVYEVEETAHTKPPLTNGDMTSSWTW